MRLFINIKRNYWVWMNLLIDLDDTLYPEKMYIYEGFWAVARFLQDKYNLKAVKVYLKLISIFKDGSSKIFDDFLNRENITENPLHLVDIYRNAKRELTLYPDVLESLESLRSLGNKLILLTNGCSEVQRKKIEILKIEKYFDDIFVLNDFGKDYWKPSTLILNKIFAKYGLNLTDYYVIGNGQEDLEFAKQAGIKFIFVDRSNSVRKAKIEDKSEIYIIKNLKELVPIIGRSVI